jgi:hypothetical protein
LPALVLDDHTQVWGAYILAFGWVGWNLAWLSNFCFLIAVRKLGWKNAPAILSPILAGLLALDTFRLNSVLRDEGGATTPVYGYQWGTIVWLAAMTVLVIAAGIRPLERAPSHAELSTRRGMLWTSVGVVALVSMLAGTIGFFILDRRNANQAEQTRLLSVVFKRGPVCRLEGPVSAIPLDLNGPLEIEGKSIVGPFDTPWPLLSWGVPVVRMGGFDYSYLGTGTEPILIAKQSSGDRGALLTVDEQWLKSGDGRRIRTTLSTSAMRSFDQKWEPDMLGRRHCPEYSNHPTSTEQPRALITSALRILGKPLSPVARETEIPRPDKPPILKTKIITHRTYSPDVRGVQNLGCPTHTGFEERPQIQLKWYRPFKIAQGYLFMPSGSWHYAICLKDAVYFVKNIETLAGRDSFFWLEKRSLQNFERIWSKSIRIPHDHGFSVGRRVQVLSLTDQDGVVTIDFLDPVEHKGFTLQVELAT